MVAVEPIPASRPRFGRGKAYICRRDLEYRQQIKHAAAGVMDGQEPLTESLVVVVNLFRKIKANSRRYGDLDNHLKNIFDSLNGTVFIDDAQIVDCRVSKHTDKTSPRLEVEITTL